MAVRNEARVWTSIWGDPHFLRLSAHAQRLYLLLISQSNLNFAGVLDTTRGRWAQLAPDTAPTVIARAQRQLHQARFLVVDDTTEETLVRSFIRNDKVWKQPKLLRIAITEALAVASAPIRAAIAEELARCDPHELSDDPTRRRIDGQIVDGPSVRAQVAEMLPDAIRAIDPYPRNLHAPGQAPPEAPPQAPRDAPAYAPAHGHR